MWHNYFYLHPKVPILLFNWWRPKSEPTFFPWNGQTLDFRPDSYPNDKHILGRQYFIWHGSIAILPTGHNNIISYNINHIHNNTRHHIHNPESIASVLWRLFTSSPNNKISIIPALGRDFISHQPYIFIYILGILVELCRRLCVANSINPFCLGSHYFTTTHTSLGCMY